MLIVDARLISRWFSKRPEAPIPCNGSATRYCLAMAEGADPPPPRPPGGALRTVVLVLIGAALASVAFWIARREPAPPRQEAIIQTGPAPDQHRVMPVLPGPQKGPGNERLAGIVVDGAGAAVAGVHVTATLEPGEGGKAGKPAPAMPAVVAVADARGAFVLEG